MSIEPNSPISLGLIYALDRLGIKGSTLPGILPGLQPVLVMGDIHDSIASEIVEARKICGGFADPGVNYVALELTARSAGGLVVEDLTLVVEDFGLAGIRTVWVYIGTWNQPLGGIVSTPAQADIGGLACVSSILLGSTPISPYVLGAPYFVLPCLTQMNTGGQSWWWGAAKTRIFLRPSEQLRFVVGPTANGRSLGWQITWRELQDIQGAA